MDPQGNDFAGKNVYPISGISVKPGIFAAL
jgi:hypothetical protein